MESAARRSANHIRKKTNENFATENAGKENIYSSLFTIHGRSKMIIIIK